MLKMNVLMHGRSALFPFSLIPSPLSTYSTEHPGVLAFVK